MVDLSPIRLRGRPQTGSEDQRERLVDAARDLFAASGYAATSLRQVSLRAGVTAALAHYYFKDKAGLMDAVVHERIAPLVDAIQAVVEQHADDSVAALAAFVQQFTRASARHSWLPRLLMRELVDSDGQAKVMRLLAEKLHTLVAAGQASHAIRADLGAQSVALSVLSLCVFPRQLQMTAASATDMILHNLAVLRDGLKSRARSSP
ncbi:MAG: TetR/AcrR family transcriptional regulator [Pseudomonadota bacterium]